MDFLADESCDFVVVRALRAKGHNVAAVSEIASGSADEAVVVLALQDRRVLLTEDKDFGQIVLASGKRQIGVVLMRFGVSARPALAAAVLESVDRLGDRLARAFVVIEPGRIRATFWDE